MRKVEEERATGQAIQKELRTVKSLLEREVGEGVDPSLSDLSVSIRFSEKFRTPGDEHVAQRSRSRSSLGGPILKETLSQGPRFGVAALRSVPQHGPHVFGHHLGRCEFGRKFG